MTVRTSASGGQAIALITDGDDIVIKNGSIVDAFAEGKFSVAISTRNHQPNVAGGHIYISDSVVKAIAAMSRPVAMAPITTATTKAARSSLSLGV